MDMHDLAIERAGIPEDDGPDGGLSSPLMQLLVALPGTAKGIEGHGPIVGLLVKGWEDPPCGVRAVDGGLELRVRGRA